MKLTTRSYVAAMALLSSTLIFSCSKNEVAPQSIDSSSESSNKKFATVLFTVKTADGFATGTTGGAGGSSVTVTSASAFKTAAESSATQIITVNGSLDLGSTSVSINSNKTIIGANESSSIKGNLRVSNKTNVIIQNLKVSNPTGAGTGDAIEISGSTKVFVTKCTIFDAADGGIDIVRASDNVTISWCRFYYAAITEHQFANLIGNGDDATGDRGKLHVTMHHNWYDNGVNSRMPRVRFGYVHLYNNYYGSNNDSYSVGVGNEAHIHMENNTFENQSKPWQDMRSSTSIPYHIKWSNHVYINSPQPTWATNSSSIFSKPYTYSMHTGSAIKTSVVLGAGNKA